MAVEFVYNLLSQAMVNQNHSNSNRFQEEVNRKAGDTKFNQEQLLKASEKINSEPGSTSSYRFQESLPVTNTLKTIRIFNETKKPSFVTLDSLQKLKELPEAKIEELDESKTVLIGKGFYVVSGNISFPKWKLLPSVDEDAIRNKLSEVYNQTSKKKNGNLVNLTF
ncbi:MAG: hypothetical protein AB1394_05955, partial [Bacteroidota bacterium]